MNMVKLDLHISEESFVAATSDVLHPQVAAEHTATGWAQPSTTKDVVQAGRGTDLKAIDRAEINASERFIMPAQAAADASVQINLETLFGSSNNTHEEGTFQGPP